MMGPKRKPDRQSLKETTLQGYGRVVAPSRDNRMAWLRPATLGYAVKSKAMEWSLRRCLRSAKASSIRPEKGDLIAWLLTVEGEVLYPAARGTGPIRAQEE
jgi:hypothetical protein